MGKKMKEKIREIKTILEEKSEVEIAREKAHEERCKR